VAGDEPAIGDELLVARAQEDPAAFVALYRRHYDGIFRYCVHRVFDRSAAEDVTSTVFMKVVQNLPKFVHRGNGFRNWLYCIANNAVADYLRAVRQRAARERAASLPEGVPADDPPSLEDDEAALLRQAILKLNPRQQTIVAMRYFDGMQLTDVAAILGSSPATVRSQLSRALASLRKGLARLSPAGSREVHRDA
jgi:RNA polymerase sigma-70 factor (ECF subfamily)